MIQPQPASIITSPFCVGDRLYYIGSPTVPIVTWGTTTNLVWATGTNTTVSVTVTNLTTVYHNNTDDVMFDSYLYSSSCLVMGDYNEETMEYITINSNPKVVISGLPAGTYDLLIYGLGGYGEDQGFSLTVGTTTTSTKPTSYIDPLDTNWTENTHYVKFTNQTLNAGDTVTVNLTAGSYDYTHVINGIQIIDWSSTNTTSQLPSVTFTPASGTTVPTDVTLSVSNHNDATIYYTLDGSTPTTNSSLYSTAISISSETTIKAFATKPGYSASPVSSATYPLSQLPIVTFDPSHGTTLPTVVTLYVTNHTNATIYYTTDGSTPTTNSSVYTTAISLTTNSWSYSADVVPAMTSYTTPSGNTVTYSSELSGSSRYAWKAFDHSVATQDDNHWSANSAAPEWVALEFPSTRHIAAYALQCRVNSGDGPKSWTFEGWNGSQYVTLDTRSNETNWYAAERRVFVCTNSAAYIKYRLNISEGNASAINTNAYIVIGELEMFEAKATISAFASKANYLDSDITFAYYFATASTVPQIAPTPNLSPASGNYANDIQVTIDSSLSGASYWYSTDGTNWLDYTNAISVAQNTTVMAYTTKSGYTDSGIRTNSYTFTVAPTMISPNGGNFTNPVQVTLTNATANATIQYRLNGSALTNYTGPLTLTNTIELTAVATKSGYTSSANSATFTAVDLNAPPGQLLNVNFGSGTKTGYAAVGNGNNDVWNVIGASSLATNSNLLWANGSNSPVSVVVSEMPYSYGTSHPDPMMNTYIHGDYYGSPELRITGLSSNVYDFYFLAQNGPSSYETARFGVEIDSNTSWSDWTSAIYDDGQLAYGPFIEGLHFVAVRNVVVPAGTTVKIYPNGSSAYGYFNGMQIMVRGAESLTLPVPNVTPAAGTYTEPVTVNIQNPWVGATNRYSLDGSTWLTNSSVVLESSMTVIAQSFRSGYNASPYVTNSYTVNLPSTPTPSVTPAGAEYAEAKSVTLYSALAGATFRYSVNDGSTWTTNGVVRLTTNATLLAQTLKFGYQPGAVVTNTYQINTNLTVSHGGVLNVNFGSGTRVGLAATGLTANDYWNVVGASASASSFTNPITSLVWSDTNAAGVTMVVSNLATMNQTYHPDPMLDKYLSGTSFDGENSYGADVKVRNLPSGTYDFYIYMMGADTEYGADHTGCELITSTGTNATKWANSSHQYIDPETALTEGLQYVVFTNVTVAAGTTVTFQLHSDGYAYALNGMQIRNPNVSTALPEVTFSPASGTVPVEVTLSVPGHTNATIYYTANGSQPTTNSTVYSSVLSLTNATTIKAMATKAGYEDASVTSASYTLPQLPSVTFDPVSGTSVPANVTLAVTGHTDATIYYTLNGSTPTTNSTVFSSAISLTNATTIKAFATKTNYLDSVVASAQYPLPVAPLPDISPVTGNYANDIQVTIDSSLSGASYWYSTDGTNWLDYTNAISVAQNTTVMAYTTKSGYTDSGIRTNSYTFTVAPTMISPNGGNFTNPVQVTLTNATANATIQYRLNGSALTNYTGPLTLTNTTELIAVASKTGYTSSTNTATFTSASTPPTTAEHLLNLNFGDGSKAGMVVIGNGSNDNWNIIPAATNVLDTYTIYGTTNTVPIITVGTTTNLVWANGSNTTISVTITNLTTLNHNGTSDPMFNSYLGADYYLVSDDYNADLMEHISILANPKVEVSGLPTGTYDFYVYGMGTTNGDNQGFTLTIGSNAPTSTKYTTHLDPPDVNWTENTHYVRFTNLTVNAGETVTLSFATNINLTHLINGLQIIDWSSTNPALSQLPAATFAPVDGTAVPVDVTLSVGGHADASIYYTTNGSTPTTNSAVFSSALSLTAATTIKAFATKTGFSDSTVSMASYPLPQLPQVTFSPTNGSTVPVDVTLSVPSHTNATIYYTLNGTTPNTNSTAYTGTISLTNEITIKAFAVKTGYADSAISTAQYLWSVALAPTISPVSGDYHNDIQVTIASSMAGASYKYSTNGTDWFDYTNAVPIGQATTLMAYTVKSGYLDSAVTTNNYAFSVANTVILPFAGTFTNDLSVTFFNETTGASLEYKWNEGNFQPFTGTFLLVDSGTLTVVAQRSGYSSRTNAFTFTRVPDATPVAGRFLNFNFGGGVKTGLAATGQKTNDLWNMIGAATNVAQTYTYAGGGPTVPILTWGTSSNLLFSDGRPSTVMVAVTNLTQPILTGIGDEMMGSYLSSDVVLVSDFDPVTQQPFTITADPRIVINNLPTGLYDFYFYGLGTNYANAITNDNEGYRLRVGNGTSTSWKRTTHPGFVDADWQEDHQYVRFTNITVTAGQPVLISLAGNQNYRHLINGMQVVNSSAPLLMPQLPAVAFSPPGGTNLPVSVSLAVPGNSDAVVYYTTNGNFEFAYTANGLQPITNSTVYAGPISLGSNSWSYINEIGRFGNDSIIATSSGWGLGVFTRWPSWWAASPGPEWISVQLSGARNVAKYALSAPYDSADAPKSWTFEGWDGAQYVVLDTQTNETNWEPAQRREYVCATNGYFIKYRFNITAGNATEFNPNALIVVGQIELMEAKATISAFATKFNYLPSPISSASFSTPAAWLTPTAPASSVSPAGAGYGEPLNLTFSSSLPGAKFRYSTNGIDWYTNSTLFLNHDAVLQVQAFKNGYYDGPVGSHTYYFSSLDAPPPVLFPPGGQYAQPVRVSVFSELAGAGYRWSTNSGSDWVTNDNLLVSESATVLAQSFKYGYADSAVVTNSYVIDTNLTAPAAGLLNWNFGSGTKVGYAANGQSTNDVWNLVGASNAVASALVPLTNAVWADGTAALVGLRIEGLTNAWSYSHPDPMLGSYLSGSGLDTNSEPVVVRLQILNLPAGTYDLYCYGIGSYPMESREGFQVVVGGVTNDWKYTNPNGEDFNPATEPLKRGKQYVLFPNVAVPAGETVVVNLRGVATMAENTVNGLQILPSGTGIPVAPSPSVSPIAEFFTNAIQVTISNELTGAYLVYSTNGINWADYTAPFDLDGTNVLYAQTLKSGYVDSEVTTNQFWFVVSPTLISTNSPGTNSLTYVTLTNATQNAQIQYSVTGSPLTNYTGPFWTPYSAEITAVASKPGYVSSTNSTDVIMDDGGAKLLNLNFGGDGKVGLAATGLTSADIWNSVSPANNVAATYTYSNGGETVPILTWRTTTNLLWADGSNSTVSVTITNLTRVGTNSSPDNMLNHYLWSDYFLVYDYNPATQETNVIKADPKIIIQNLPQRNYEVYLYGIGGGYGDEDGFSITVGTNPSTAFKFTSHPGVISSGWLENQQYVVFSNVVVTAGETVTIRLAGNYNYTTLINGLQIIETPAPAAPPPKITPASGVYDQPISVTVTSLLAGASYLYRLNGGSWLPYTAPVLRYQTATFEAKTIKPGYRDSDIRITTYSFYQVPVPPTVAIETPWNGQVFSPNTPITLRATADPCDPTGFVNPVGFYSGTNVITRVYVRPGEPFEYLWQDAPVGIHLLAAKANDGYGNEAWSEVVKILVDDPPVVSITAPVAGSFFHGPESITVSASASDPDGMVTNVQFFADNLLIGSAPTAPFTVEWPYPALGGHTLTAVATDNYGLSATSAPVAIQVTDLIPSLRIVGGNYQSGWSNAILPTPLTVEAVNANGTLITNLPVTFSAAEGTGQLRVPTSASATWAASTTALSLSNGRASVWARIYSATNALTIITASAGLPPNTHTVTFALRTVPHGVRLSGDKSVEDGQSFLLNPAQIEIGQALMPDGTLWYWNAWQSGALLATQREGITNATAIAGSGYLKADGTVWYWAGTNAVQIPELCDIVAITGSMALNADGTVWVRGENNYGQLGDGGISGPSYTYIQVPGVSGIVAIASGSFHNVALKADGTVMIWGHNGPWPEDKIERVFITASYGNRNFVPYWDAYYMFPSGMVPCSTDLKLQPVQVPRLTGVKSIVAGDGISVALKWDGTVWAWGYGWGSSPMIDYGASYDARPGPVQVPDLTDVRSISLDGANNIYAIKNNGSLWAWVETLQVSENWYIVVNAFVQLWGANVVAVASGWRSGLYTIVTDDGKIRQWDGRTVQLPNGSGGSSTVSNSMLRTYTPLK